MRKILMLTALCLMFILSACGSSASKKVAATVNGVDITMERFEKSLTESLASYGLDEETLRETYGLEEAIKYKNGGTTS